jgi:tetratricopeptide (TPR) repeat protein
MRLRTRDGIALMGDGGEIPLDEPRLTALVVVLAIAGKGGAAADELMLLLTPGYKPEAARLELARLVAVARLRLGGETSIVPTDDGYALRPGLLTLDVRVRETDAATECVAFMAGFRLPESPEFQEWLARTRRRVEALPMRGRRDPRRLATVGGIAAIVVMAIVGFVAARRADHRIAIGEPMLLADLMNETGDSVFDVSLTTAAAIGLQQSGRLRLYPRQRLPQVYRVMSIANPDTALTFELAQNVAQRDGVRFVLGLQIGRAGDAYRLTGRLADVSSSRAPASMSVDAASRDDVLRALDTVLLQVRRQLGEANDEMRDRRESLPFVTTASLEALRSYSDGSASWARGDYRAARDLFLRAVDLDTSFAMAYGALGMTYYYFHDRVNGDRYYKEAFERSARLTERERLRLMESWYGNHGRLDSAVVYTGLLAKRYPSVPTWYNYGTALMQAQRYDEASTALHTALTFDPTHTSSYINLATVANSRQRFDTAVAYYLRAARTDSTALYRGNINHEYGGALVRLGRYAEAESAFTKMSVNPRIENRALGLRSLGYLGLWRGRVDDAIGYYRQALDATMQVKAPLSEARNRMLLSTAYRTAGRNAEASIEIRRTLPHLDSVYFEPQLLAMLATNVHALGETRHLPAILRAMRAKRRPNDRVDAAADAYVAGLIALSAGRADSALVYARAATALPTRVPRLMLTAEAFRLLGQMDSARVTLEAIIASDGFGLEGQDYWLRAPIVLGDVLLTRGDTAAAAAQYQRFLNQWRGASADLADIAMARSRLASLRPAGPR